MPITKQLDHRDGVIFVTDVQSGKLLLAVSEDYGLKNNEVMNLLLSIHRRTGAIEDAYLGKSRIIVD